MRQADLIMVVGLRPKDDVIEPGLPLGKLLRARVQKACELYDLGVSQTLLMSGGFTYDDSVNPPLTEAHAMAEYAHTLRIPQSRLVKEEVSLHTVGNIYFGKRDIIQPSGARNIVIVTSDYHAARTQYIAEHIFGPEYAIEVAGAQSQLDATVLGDRLEKEKKFLGQFTTQFKAHSIPGDNESIGKVIRQHFADYKDLI